MDLVGPKHLYAVRTKAMALLKLALQEPNPTEYAPAFVVVSPRLPRVCIEGRWQSFIIPPPPAAVC